MAELWEEWSDYNYAGWDNQVADLYASLFSELSDDGNVGWGDTTAQMYFDLAFFSNETMDLRSAARDALIDYLSEEYNIDFSDSFDWEGYREWYDAH